MSKPQKTRTHMVITPRTFLTLFEIWDQFHEQLQYKKYKCGVLPQWVSYVEANSLTFISYTSLYAIY